MDFIFITARYALVTLALTALTGCGYFLGDGGMFRDKSEDYKTAPEVAVLKVPDGKDSGALREIYAIPQVEDQLILVGEFEVPRPIPLVAGAADEVVRIQKLGADSWALVAIAPGQVWPQVRSFISSAGIQIARMDARAGVMETAWVELDGQEQPSRFRFRIDQGVQRGNSELHVLQMYKNVDPGYWPQKSDNSQQESEMLRGVAQYLANSTDSAPVSMVANRGIDASGKISLQEAPEGYSYLRVGLNFDRAWASLSKALETATFEITDKNRSAGEYFVRFLGPDANEEDGWFDWVFDGDEEHPMAGRQLLVTMARLEESAVSIRIDAIDPSESLAKREEQSMLTLIKGSIN